MSSRSWIQRLENRVSARRRATEARGETFYQGASRIDLASFPPREQWDDWVAADPAAARAGGDPQRHYALVPTTCFNCESACGLLAYVDKETLSVRKFEGNPEHPGSRGRNCAKGPATVTQLTDPDRILYPLKRSGDRGSGRWRRVSWDEVLDDLAGRIRRALEEKRQREIMYHVGRPGEDGFTERVLAAWGVDGHNSHTNICSSGGRAGYHYWMGFDRPSADFANARVILLVSAHLESGHYFNPHAQRIMEARKAGAKVIVLDVRMSNSATHADHWLAPYPGSEPAIFLSIARYLIRNRRYNRAFVERWWNWRDWVESVEPGQAPTFERFEALLAEVYDEYSFDFAARESGLPAAQIEEIAEVVAGAGTALATHNWRSAAAGNLGGWQVSRTLFLLNALMGAVGTPGGVFPGGWNKFVPRPPQTPPHPDWWNELTYPQEYPLGMNEMSFLLPYFLREGRGRLDVYFTRVYNPVWTNPGGFAWVDVLRDEDLVGLHVALTPTWNETAYFADYVLPMGISSERHDLHSYETHDGQWIGFRQPVLRAARERMGERVDDSREVNPGEVWEENEFWLELTWRIDADGSLGIRPFAESRQRPGQRVSVDEYYGEIFAHAVPGLADKAAAEGLSPLDYMRRYGAFEVARGAGALHESPVPAEELEDLAVAPNGRAYTAAPAPEQANAVPTPAPEPDARGRRPVGVEIDGELRHGFPTPSGRLEFYSPTLADWGWPEYALPTYIHSHIHPTRLEQGQLPLISTFRLPVHIHTRSANAKWLNEIAHTNPVWIHPRDATRLGIRAGALVRVETEIGYFVARAWVTEGIRPGVVACSHHMGRWHVQGGPGSGQITRSVILRSQDSRRGLQPAANGAGPAAADGDRRRIWWSDVGVHQNLTFPVHPDPVSGQHCWHQAVRVRPAENGDAHGDVWVDTALADRVYREWLAMTRPARQVSPDGSRRPYWLLRPLKPTRDAYRLPPDPAATPGDDE